MKFNKEYEKIKLQYTNLLSQTIESIWTGECTELLKRL